MAVMTITTREIINCRLENGLRLITAFLLVR
jgi:hypothetical protein